MTKNSENTNAFLIHISAFAGFLFPFGNIITPLIAWQTLKNRSLFLDSQGKEAVNFNISYSLYIFLLGVSVLPAFFSIFHTSFGNFNSFNMHFNSDAIFGIVGLTSIVGLLGLIKFALIIIAATKSKEGEHYRYPFTIKFIK